MKFAAMVIALLGLVVGVYAVTVDLPNYEEVRRAWMSQSPNYDDPGYERLSQARDEVFVRVETEGVLTIALALGGLVLGIVATVRKGGAPAVASIVLAVGAGICGAVIASSPGLF